MKYLYFSAFLLFSSSLFAQKNNFSVLSIPDSLKQNANAVVRLYDINIEIVSQRLMKIKTIRAVTVLNENGRHAIDGSEWYSKKSTVNSIEAIVYDAFGNEIKKLKRKDFKDYSSYDGFSVFSDNRNLVLEYTPTQYPFTIVYQSEKTTSTTAFIPSWMPISDYFVSIEKSNLTVSFPTDLGFKKKEINFDGFSLKKETEIATQMTYSANNIPAIKPENLTPANGFLPRLMMGLEKFNLEGVDGSAKTWKEYGQWYDEKILTGTDEISEEAIAKIKAVIGTETDPIKKAKLVYKFVQDKSRYVSIQVGIGGWKPMVAKDVDRLGYGDCKALSNYTRTLLKAVDVPSYNTLLYGDKSKHNFQEDFVSMQGNHMILCIPTKEKNIFLECTSQDDPFGYQAGFTDDRQVLLIKPDGGEIVKTTNYPDKSNTQISNGNYKMDENGSIIGSISIQSEGTQYKQKVGIEKELPDEKDKHYKEYWDNISNLKINKMNFITDKEKISFIENIEIEAENYGKFTGNNLIFTVNAYNNNQTNLKRIRNRKTPFEIQRGFVDIDEIAIQLPTGFKIDFMPPKVEINNKFGEYKFEVIKKDDFNLIYKRTFFLKNGLYPNTEYENYRLFREQISQNDNAKIILSK